MYVIVTVIEGELKDGAALVVDNYESAVAGALADVIEALRTYVQNPSPGMPGFLLETALNATEHGAMYMDDRQYGPALEAFRDALSMFSQKKSSVEITEARRVEVAEITNAVTREIAASRARTMLKGVNNAG